MKKLLIAIAILAIASTGLCQAPITRMMQMVVAARNVAGEAAYDVGYGVPVDAFADYILLEYSTAKPQNLTISNGEIHN